MVIASIRWWKMSGAEVINYLVYTCFDVNSANSSQGEDGPGVCSPCNSLFLVEKQNKPKMWRTLLSEGKCFEKSQSFEIIYMVWGSYFFFPPVWYRASSPSVVQLPWSPRQWLLGSLWWTWSSSWVQGSCLCHQLMCCGAPVLQTGFNHLARRCSKAARVPREADDLLQNVVFAVWSWKSQLSQEDRKGTPNFPMLQCEVVLGFFCSFMHIFLIWIQAWCHLPSLPQCICGFSHTLITSTTSP